MMNINRGHKSGIARKIMFAIALSTACVIFISTGLAYFFGSKILMNMLGREYSQVAKALGSHTIKKLEDEIDDAKTYATRPLWKDAVIDVGLKYSNMSKQDIENYMADMDKKWINAQDDSLFLIEYLRNRISLSMQDTAHVRSAVSEIFITDKYGGLVASSGKTTDFYQADEDWWKAAYNNGKGDVFVGDIEFDDSSGSWIMPIAVPMVGDNQEVVGILRYGISITRLFGYLSDFKIGKTGSVILIDKENRIIFQHGAVMTREHLYMDKGLGLLYSSSKPYKIIADKLLGAKKMFVASSKIDLSYLNIKNISWFVFVVQEWPEISGFLDKFTMSLLVIALFAIILIVPLGAILGGMLAKPLHELRIATEHVMAGEMDYTVKIKTGDEIEQLAGAFARMVENVKNKQNELENFSSGLEEIVKDRTEELNTAQEATLNILEDLQTAKDSLERSNRELMKLDQLKSDFISTVSHELRTPLSIIKEGISLVLDKIPGDLNEKQSKILDISKSNIDRLARIIDGLLDLSKIESGKIEVKKALIDISGVVRQAAASFEPKIKEKGLEMNLDIDNDIGNVWADADKITQVLTNLIGNAVKFTNSGHINISCKDKGDGVVCSVSDTGVGIAKDDLSKAFDKFQQFGRVAGSGDKGTGLGLSIAKGIIDMHNGAIWVESEFGKGARFAFKLRKYTSQSLFGERVSKAIKKAEDKGAKMSIIAVNASLTRHDVSGAIKDRFDDIMRESARLIKDTLKREGDDVINIGSDTIVILADCDKESAARVQRGLWEIVGKYLAGQNSADAIKIKYGCATYPDDAKGDLELIEKARLAYKGNSSA